MPQALFLVNLSEAGWTLRRGQAVWKPHQSAPELAGEYLLATHTSGRWWFEFSKSPFQFVEGVREGDGWQIRFPSQKRTFAGRGEPPERYLWFRAAEAAQRVRTGETWRVERPAGGEFIEGRFLE